MYKNELVLLCKTFHKDIECFLLQAQSVKKYNIHNIPYYISVPEADVNLFENLKLKYNLTYDILKDEDISCLIKNQDYISSKFNVSYINQQLVKLEFYKTNLAKHYVVIDSDCYFIRDFNRYDFLYDSETPLFPISEGGKGERLFDILVNTPVKKVKVESTETKKLSLEEFIGRPGKYYTIEMPFVITSAYMEDFENEFLKKEKNMTLKDTLIEYPAEMQLYCNYLIKKRFNYQACSAIFLSQHNEYKYAILRLLGFDEEMLSQSYAGILMNNGYVKSTRFKPSFLGKYIVKPTIRFYHSLTKQRVPIFIKILLSAIPSRKIRIKIREYYR